MCEAGPAARVAPLRSQIDGEVTFFHFALFIHRQHIFGSHYLEIEQLDVRTHRAPHTSTCHQPPALLH